MLRIGPNHYELVRAHSGFTVALTSRKEDAYQREQEWELEAHFVPADTHHTPRPDGELEYLVLSIAPETYKVADWQQLSGFGLDQDGDWFGTVSLENRLVGRHRDHEHWRVIPAWLEVERQRDYLFHCEFHGFLKQADGTEVEMEFKDDLPFREAVVYVPINAATPEATARAMAARMIQFTKPATSRLLTFDPTRASFLNIRINSHHCVTLPTPWRQLPG